MSPRPDSGSPVVEQVDESVNGKNLTKDEIAMGVPEKVPTLVEIKNAIPSHCFKPDIPTSLYYMFKDYVIVGALYASMVMMERQPYAWLTYAYMPLYWYLQGTFFASLFIIGHDCGHGSFSASEMLNDIVGNITNSTLMVPYYPWKLSHRHHHKNTGNIDKDNIYFPLRKSIVEDGKGSPLVPPYFFIGLRWYRYTIGGGADDRPVSLYLPFKPFYAKHALACIISLACNVLWFTYVIMPYVSNNGFTALLTHYLLPLFVFAYWVVFVTFLQHHDDVAVMPWYADEKWDYVRGQLSSIDRHYGWCHDLIHNVGTHQIHHMFSKVPHYHLEEATAAFRKKFPMLVRKSDENVMVAFLKIFPTFHKQMIIPKDKKIHVYQYDNKKE